MKKQWLARVARLEESAKFLYDKYFFEEWFRDHFDPDMPNYWDLLDIAPKECHIACILRVLKEPGLPMHQGDRTNKSSMREGDGSSIMDSAK